MPKVYLSLGSNMGDRKAYLRAAVKILRTHKDIRLTEVSSVYETDPEDLTSQRRFYNLAVGLETKLSPAELLHVCQFIEEFLQRERKIKWGPRTIDVDILIYGSEEVKESNLQIPHARLAQRAFMLIPLLEIAPHVKLPTGIPVREYLNLLKTKAGVRRIGSLER